MSTNGPYYTEVVSMDVEWKKGRRLKVADFASEIEKTANSYHKDGMDLVKVIQVIDGDNDYIPDEPEQYYGISFTESVVLLFKDRNHTD